MRLRPATRASLRFVSLGTRDSGLGAAPNRGQVGGLLFRACRPGWNHVVMIRAKNPTPRPWQLSELATAGRENLDAEHASHYDEKEPWPAEEEVRLAQRLGVGPSATVVDLGAGTGQFALAAARHFQRIVAVDVSEVMLRVLERKVEEAGHRNVELELGGFLTYRHEGEPADLVYSRYALHHIPDFWKALALRNIHGMLRPGGILRIWDIVYSFEPTEAEEMLERWCSTLDDVPAEAEWVRSDIEDHIRDEHSTFSWLLEAMIQRTGFSIDTAEYSEDRLYAKYVLRSH